MARNQITLQLEGIEPGRDDVRLSDLAHELWALREVLGRTDAAITGRKTVDWRVVGMSLLSPATVTVEPDVVAEELLAGRDYRDEIVKGFFSRAEALTYNRIAPADMDRDFLLAFKKLAGPVRGERLRAVLKNGAQAIEIAGELETVIDAILEPTTRTLGSAQGKLEYMDIHGDTRVFRIYSDILPRRVICHFPDKLLEDAKQTIGRMVRVYGEITYREREVHPDSIKVEEIEGFPSESELPTLSDLRGMAPGSPSDPPAEDLVRDTRVD